ncbi:MAG TPA: tetratricopeptide repeat protein [Planctomycetaceae bacterium]|nr:tetratricopeptide repeat protein [Planctomycetaceae bacterium]
MDERSRSRREKLLAEAEGYIALGMHAHALASLERIEDSDESEFRVNFLRGDALRNLERHEEALVALHRAFDKKPDDVGLLMALAWCYKRTNQLPRAITCMEQAYRIAPKEAVILYNLSCYWSLAGNKTQSLSWLGRALRMDNSLRQLIDDETDFDSLRNDRDFQMIVDAVNRTG